MEMSPKMSPKGGENAKSGLFLQKPLESLVYTIYNER